MGSSMMSVTLRPLDNTDGQWKQRWEMAGGSVTTGTADGRARARDGLGERPVLLEVVADVCDLVQHHHGWGDGEDCVRGW